MARRAFSLYDIEQFLKEVGAERVSETAVMTLGKELEDTLKELVEEAEIYANYAGRRIVHRSDVELVSGARTNNRRIVFNGTKNGRALSRKKRKLRFVQMEDANVMANASSTNPISMSHI